MVFSMRIVNTINANMISFAIQTKKVLALVAVLLMSVSASAQPRGLELRRSEKLADAMFVVVNNPGELQLKIPVKMIPAIRRLKVEGVLSTEDVSFLRKLATRTSLKDTLGKRLEPFFDLDLMDATIPARGVSNRRSSVIPDYFLNGSKLLRRVFLPINTDRVSDYAFQNCENLREVHMPMTVTSFGRNAFKGCKSLTVVSSPRALNTIENGCFEDCKNLQHFALFNGLVKIGNTAFKNTAITAIRLPETVKQIGNEAFANTAIETINIPDGMQEVNARAFEGCYYLKDIRVSAQNSYYSNVDGILFNKQRTVIVRVPVSYGGSYMIPEGVISIGSYAFSECKNISEVLFPSTLTRIGESAFRNCKNIREAELPASVQSLGRAAFAGCGLNGIDLSGIKQMGQEVFLGCVNLSEVRLPMLEQLPASSFQGCRSLAAIELPKTLKSIGKKSFKGCQKLTKIELPQSLTAIDEEAFADCLSLEDFEFPTSATTIGSDILHGCKNLKTVTCPWKEPIKIKTISNNKATLLRVPSGAEELYHKAKGWKKFKQIDTF